jgi:formylglycine-generating enzyme required for sulfatase activity
MKNIFIGFHILAIILLTSVFSTNYSTAQTNPKSSDVTEMKDCPDCPEFVIIKPGSFTMGSPSTEEGREEGETQHSVTILKSFALGKYPVTKGEFRQFVTQTGYNAKGKCFSMDDKGNPSESEIYNWETPGFNQKDNEPVVCVDAVDAEAYAAWLSKKTSKSYRLPTEAEYEYAARAGTTTARYWGESQDDGCTYANGIGYEAQKVFWGKLAKCDDGFIYTSPVGSYKPNAFGLYDMLGNAWVWLADCWHDSYAGGPDTKAPWMEQGCNARVMRGGSYISNYTSLRAAARHKAGADQRFHNYGIRIVRDVTPQK